MMRLASWYPGAAFAPKMNVQGVTAVPGFALIRLYRVMMWSSLRSWRLYSCSRLAMTSYSELGSMVMPVAVRAWAANLLRLVLRTQPRSEKSSFNCRLPRGKHLSRRYIIGDELAVKLREGAEIGRAH